MHRDATSILFNRFFPRNISREAPLPHPGQLHPPPRLSAPERPPSLFYIILVITFLLRAWEEVLNVTSGSISIKFGILMAH
jgi:hypothetical protein